MSLTRAEIAAVVRELAPLVGGAVQAIHAPAPRTLVLRVRVPGQTYRLLLSAEADLCRLHLVDRRPAGAPAPFQAGCRAELEGAWLGGLSVAGDNRVVTLTFEGRAGPRRLVAELTGRHGNLFLLDDAGILLHTAVPNLSRRRHNLRGQPYEPPRPRPGEGDDIVRLEARPGPFGMNAAVAAVYGPRARAARLDAHRRQLARPLKTVAARHRRTLKRLDADAARAADADRLKHQGELLKSVLHQVRRGDTEVRVTDWYDPAQPTVAVPLRAELSPQENLARLFHLHRRLRDAPARVVERREEVEAALARVEALLDRLAAAEDDAALEAVGAEAVPVLGPGWSGGGRGGGGAGRRGARIPYRRFQSHSGRDILVGRGAKDDHALTFKVARGNDLWLHARDQTGAHVVVPTGGRGEVDEATLLDAAHLAAWFSRARGEPQAEIAWTQRKRVHHPKGAPPGLVTLVGEKTLHLRVEPGRTERLLASELPA